MSMHKGMLGKIGPSSADVTLGDYITRKQQAAAFDAVVNENKLTFDEWYSKFPALSIPDLEKVRYWKYKSIWEAAQENK